MMRVCFMLAALCGVALAGSDSGIAGEWEGEYICTGVRAACVDEHVIWTFKDPDRDGHVSASTDKVVGGVRQNMGSGEFQFDAKTETMTWKIPLGIWKFTRKKDAMDGILTLNDGQVARNVSLKRVVR